MEQFILKGEIFGRLTDDEFFQFCQEHHDLRIERNNKHEIIIMSPTGTESGMIGFKIIVVLGTWIENGNQGYGFDSSTGFTLADDSVMSSAACWISEARWDDVSDLDKKKFAHVCPDFVVEILSPSDRLATLQIKMNRWIQNGSVWHGSSIPKRKQPTFTMKMVPMKWWMVLKGIP